MSDQTNSHSDTTTNSGESKAQDVIEVNGGENLLDAGLRYIQRGMKIFPCNGKKIPLTPHGFKDATTDETQIRTWAEQHPGALWGYAVPKDMVILDLDMKHG